MSKERGTAAGELRAHLGLTQRAMAERIGLTLRAWQEIERGRRYSSGAPVRPDRRTALAMSAIAFGLEPWPTTQRAARIWMSPVFPR